MSKKILYKGATLDEIIEIESMNKYWKLYKYNLEFKLHKYPVTL